ERRRTKLSGPDLLTLLLVFFSVQLLIPGAIITMFIGVEGRPHDSAVPLFDLVYTRLSLLEPAITLTCSGWWLISIYAGWLLAHEMMNCRYGPEPAEQKLLVCSPWCCSSVML